MRFNWSQLNTNFIVQFATLLVVTPFLLFPSQLILGTLVAMLLSLALLLWPFKNQWPNFPLVELNTAVFYFLVMLLVGILVTADPHLTLPKTTGLILGLTTWLFISRHATSKRHFEIVSFLFLALGLGFTILGILSANWLFKIPVISNIVRQIPQLTFLVPEAPPTGVQTNQIASTILIWIPLYYSLFLGYFADKKRLPKTIIIVVSVALILGTFLLLLTQSRSGYIGFTGGVFLLFLMWRQLLPPAHKIKKALTAVLLTGGASTLIGILILGPQTLLSIWADPNQDSLVGSLSTIGFRQEVWKWALAALSDFPFTGTGLGTFRIVVRRLYPIQIIPGYDIAHAHNIFLQTALDLGIPGLIAYLFILGHIFRMGWIVARDQVELRPLSLGILSGIAALHIFGLTDALALGAKPGILLWIGFGLISALYLHTQTAPKHPIEET